MKSRIAWSLLLFATACFYSELNPHIIALEYPPGPVKPATLPAAIKVATLNVHERGGAAVARAIARDPLLGDSDIVALQEVPADGPCDTACAAAHYLGLYAAFQPDYQRGSRFVGQAVLSRVPFETTRTIVLPDYGVHPNAALVVTLRIGGRLVTFYAVHLTDQLPFGERLAQLKPILEDARAQPTPTIIAGDFNTSINMIWHTIPLPKRDAAAKIEAFVRSYGFDTPVARSGPTWRVLPMKLDAVYTKGFDTTSFGTAHGLDVSDHLALWATMALRDQDRSGGITAGVGAGK